MSIDVEVASHIILARCLELLIRFFLLNWTLPRLVQLTTRPWLAAECELMCCTPFSDDPPVNGLLRRGVAQLTTNSKSLIDCLWKKILSQPRIKRFKILQSIYFAHDVGITSSYSKQKSTIPFSCSIEKVVFLITNEKTVSFRPMKSPVCVYLKLRSPGFLLCHWAQTKGWVVQTISAVLSWLQASTEMLDQTL